MHKFQVPSPKKLAKKCLENFKTNKVDIKLFTQNSDSSLVLENGDSFKTKQHLCDESNKSLCILIKTNDYIIDTQTKDDYLKYLFSHQIKDNPTICIEQTLYYLAGTLFIILWLAVGIDMFDNFPHKKLMFFISIIMIFLPINYMLIRKFYEHLFTTSCNYPDINAYKKQDNSWELINYTQNNIDFGKLYTYYIGGYFVIISTFTFYCSSLMLVGD